MEQMALQPAPLVTVRVIVAGLLVFVPAVQAIALVPCSPNPSIDISKRIDPVKYGVKVSRGGVKSAVLCVQIGLLQKGNDNVLTISTIASFAAKWLLPRLGTFQEAHPGIDVHITTSTGLVDFNLENASSPIQPKPKLLSHINLSLYTVHFSNRHAEE